MKQLLLYPLCLGVASFGYTNTSDTTDQDPALADSTAISDTIAISVVEAIVVDTSITIDSITGDTIAQIPMRLSEEDYQIVAERLGIEVAVIKAVVEVEAGHAHCGFGEENLPIINFDVKIFKRFASRNGIDLSSYRKTHAVVFSKPDIRKYGSKQAAQWARFNAACEIDSITSIEGTFWGMFQIGGFNWKKCGASSISEFYKAMCESEHAQLEAFANFLVSCNMVEALKKKNWNQFAYRYNGPKYKSRGYHTKLARAYRKHSKF